MRNGSFPLSFNRSSTIEERTCATARVRHQYVVDDVGQAFHDGRLTNQELAEIAGLSASQCSRRRMRLEEDKVIAGYRAELASEALGFGVIAFIQITLATHSPDNAQKFRALVSRVDDIQEAYSLTGDADYVLKAVLRDLLQREEDLEVEGVERNHA